MLECGLDTSIKGHALVVFQFIICLLTCGYWCRYGYYYALLQDFPEVQFTLNGGLTTIDQVSDYLTSDFFFLCCEQIINNWKVTSICVAAILEVGISVSTLNSMFISSGWVRFHWGSKGTAVGFG